MDWIPRLYGRRRPSGGFTLTEVMIGLVVVGIVVAAGFGYLTKAIQKAKDIANLGGKDTVFRSFGQKFIGELGGADVSLHFLRLPIPTSGCSSDGPCVMAMTATKGLQPGSMASPSAVDFFRDASATIKARAAFSSTDDTKVAYLAPLNASAVTGGKLYAAWKLTGPSSPPFMMMTRQPNGDFFNFVEELAASSPPASTDRYVFFQGSSGNIDMNALNGKLMVVYNGVNPDQHIVQYVKNGLNCATSPACVGMAKALNSQFPTALLATGNYYALNLYPAPGTVKAFFPKADSITGFGAWFSQAASIYPFPTETASFFSPTNADFEAPVDVRRLGHFFHAKDSKAKLMAVAVELTDYLIQATDAKKQQLVRRRYAANITTEMLVNDLPANPTTGVDVLFARQLGTRNISVYLQTKSGGSP